MAPKKKWNRSSGWILLIFQYFLSFLFQYSSFSHMNEGWFIECASDVAKNIFCRSYIHNHTLWMSRWDEHQRCVCLCVCVVWNRASVRPLNSIVNVTIQQIRAKRNSFIYWSSRFCWDGYRFRCGLSFVRLLNAESWCRGIFRIAQDDGGKWHWPMSRTNDDVSIHHRGILCMWRLF